MESQSSVTAPAPSPSSQYPNPRPYGPQLNMVMQQTSQQSDNDHSTAELRALDCNLTSLCDHIQMDGFHAGSFSDIVIHAMGSSYHLHRLIISRSSYFRNMLHGPWKEANSPIVNLHIDDKNVNSEAIAVALAYLYGQHPKLNDNNAFRVLAAASFLDLQDLCAICTDFIISELWTSNFLAYQVFAESQDYGIHGERVRNACWGYLCQSGSMELKEVVPKLSSQTCHALLTSDKLWVPSEEKRFELALRTFLAKDVSCKAEDPEQGSSSSESGTDTHCDSAISKGKSIFDTRSDKRLENELGRLTLRGDLKDHTGHDLLVELVDYGVGYQSGASDSNPEIQQASYNFQENLVSRCPRNTQGPSSFGNPLLDMVGSRSSCSCSEMPIDACANDHSTTKMPMEGPSEGGSCCHLNNNGWLLRDQRNCFSLNSSCNGFMPNDWGRLGAPLMSWGGRVVGRRQLRTPGKEDSGVTREEYDAFVNIFEGGSLLYCNMSFEALLNVRKQLEELGFPCKAVNDGLWLQMLLSQRVQEISVDTCKSCCLTSNACTCRQPVRFAHGVTATGYYIHENQNISPGNMYVAEPSQGGGSGLFRPVQVHVRGPIDGLAGIGRGATFVPAPAGPPTRFVFSRVPFSVGNRNYPQSLANDDSDAQTDHNGDLPGDGLTALVGLSQTGSNSASSLQVEETGRAYEMELQSRIPGTAAGGPSTGGIPIRMLESAEHTIGIEWENVSSSSITLDMKTPLTHFPPFRFGVQFEDVHRLVDGQVKHSPEVFYAGSLWKVSVQAFNDEDPQGRRTLGLFLHRRKAEINDSLRKAHLYIDTREKVTARYQLICPSKKEVMVFGSLKQTGTLLPKAPKGWGWRTALLFEELPDLLQNGALRVSAVVQLV